MNQVDFYVIGNRVKDGKLKMACRLGNKIVRLGSQIYVYTEDDATVSSLDELMWTYSDTSFIPHECRTDKSDIGPAPDTPLVISHLPPPEDCVATVLISLARQKPDFYTRFERVVEIVDCEEQDKTEGRLRFKSYQDDGLTVNHHSMEL